MTDEMKALAARCMAGAHDGTMSFPEIVGALSAAGFDGYWVDYRAGLATYYGADGSAHAVAMAHRHAGVAAAFDAGGVQAAIRHAQSGAADYSYDGFNARVTAAGCMGYLVSLTGRRVVYLARSGETHVEMMP
jgi:uncharacterized protein YbcV (DUF1398 family)